MSFDLFLVAFRNGVGADGDGAASRSVLERSRFHRQPEFHHYEVYFDDGSHLGLNAGGLHGGEKFDGAMFILHGLSEAICSFIFEFSRASGCVVFPAMDPPCVLIPRDDLAAHLPHDLSDAFARVPVASGAEVLAALNGGLDAWRAYRDHVVRTSDGGPPGGI
jgi:hypothetical protein